MATTPPTHHADDRHLTTGWEPDLTNDDTLVRRSVFAISAVNADTVRAMGGRVLEREEMIAADLGVPNAIFNAAVLTRPPGHDGWDEIADTLDDFYRDGAGPVFLFSLWPTPDLSTRGWELDGHPPLLLRPPGLPPPPVPTDLDIREVTDRHRLADFERVTVNGFPFNQHRPYEPGTWLDERVLGMPGHRMFVGYVDGEAVASGWLLVHGDLAVPVLAATLPHARKRGYWRGMLSRRLQAAEGHPVASIFSDMSRPGAERYGFIPIIRFTVWHRRRQS